MSVQQIAPFGTGAVVLPSTLTAAGIISDSYSSLNAGSTMNIGTDANTSTLNLGTNANTTAMTIGSAATALNFNAALSTTTASSTWTGPGTTASQTATFYKIGQTVIAKFPEVSPVAAGSIAVAAWGAVVPAGYRPWAGTVFSQLIPVLSNSTSAVGVIQIVPSTGGVTVAVNFGNFPNTGTYSPFVTDTYLMWTTS